ncbi:MAG TPA: 3-hydroxyacyl-ACP dehydratase [Caldimonas sp.]|nr:3-hydroxyacyl-ACP dehydratase [Caldimonas sp.]HEX2539740.1 3-hydroxyacyl-ACP dehydratase [Caldimonas sp.]
MSTTASCRVEIAPDHPAFDGHFPGQPLLPGVALLAEVLEAASADPVLAACIGARPVLEVAKFLAPVRPGTTLAIDFRVVPRSLAWTARAGEQVVASGQFGRADAASGEPR